MAIIRNAHLYHRKSIFKDFKEHQKSDGGEVERVGGRKILTSVSELSRVEL